MEGAGRNRYAMARSNESNSDMHAFIWLDYNSHIKKLSENIRGVFGKYVDKCNIMRIKYTRQVKFCINKYQLLNIKYNQYKKRTPINDVDIGH